MEIHNSANNTEWEKRSLLYGRSLRSVLFKGMPEIINGHIHEWHVRAVLNNIAAKEGLRILDVGCGYGRITLPILSKFPGAEILGLDTSDNFVKLYKETTKQKAIRGTLENIPQDIGEFDYILCVTVLMYVSEQQVIPTLNRLVKYLKPGGKLILIEPLIYIRFFLRLFGLVDFVERQLRRTRHPVDTGGRYFRKSDIETYASACHCSIESTLGMPFTTLFILPLNVIGKLCPASFTKLVLKIFTWTDGRLSRLGLPSLYAAYVISRKLS